MISPTTTLRELAFIVCTALDRAGTTAVLSGGGAATVYAPDAYQSRDLDFILQFTRTSGSEPALFELGFERTGEQYKHPKNPFTLEFPHGPLMVGDTPIGNWETLREGEMLLYILNPTDCVRDRLAGFCWWADYSALAQALLVARRHPVSLATIEDWLRAEGEEEKFEIFRHRLESGH